jgi:membrane protease YdiL (CAAX protease family)
VELLRTVVPLLLAVAVALWLDRAMARRGLLPPRFVDPPLPVDPLADPTAPAPGSGAGDHPPSYNPRLRRALGSSIVAFILWGAAFAPLAALGEAPPDPAELTIPRLFLLHGLMAAALAAWYAVAHLPRQGGPGWRVAFGLTGSPRRELVFGTGVGLAIWMSVLLALLLLAGLVSLLGGDEALPQQPPSLVLWIGALPIAARAAIALSAGIVEEIFFRGFLQPRVGILLSTVLFALAHLGYGQPFMLVGVTLLSLLYADLMRRRGSVWAPIAAHAVFDLVQLLVVVPLVAKALEMRDAQEVTARLLHAAFDF